MAVNPSPSHPVGEESHQQGGLFDVSFPTLAAPGDGFGDEELGVDLLGRSPSQAYVHSPTLTRIRLHTCVHNHMHVQKPGPLHGL